MRMRRSVMSCIAAIGFLAGCQPTETGTLSAANGLATGHGAFVASLGGDFMWDCTLTAPASGYPAQFVLQRQDLRLRPAVFMITAASGRGEVVTIEEDDFARIYTLPDSSRILVASDGEVFALDRRDQPIMSQSIGRCTSGQQTT